MRSLKQTDLNVSLNAFFFKAKTASSQIIANVCFSSIVSTSGYIIWYTNNVLYQTTRKQRPVAICFHYTLHYRLLPGNVSELSNCISNFIYFIAEILVTKINWLIYFHSFIHLSNSCLVACKKERWVYQRTKN
jgi:hypothetical protein